jgi:hypothetical protein
VRALARFHGCGFQVAIAATACTRGGPMLLASLGRRAQDGSKHLGKRTSQPNQGCLASELSLAVRLTR